MFTAVICCKITYFIYEKSVLATVDDCKITVVKEALQTACRISSTELILNCLAIFFVYSAEVNYITWFTLNCIKL